MKPTSGDRHVRAFGYVRRALDELNALAHDVDALRALGADDIARLLRARAELIHVRYASTLRPNNPKTRHG